MAQNSKAAAYLGLARKAGKLTLGVGAVETLSKGVFLLVADEAVSENTRSKIEKLQKKFACELLYVNDLGAIVGADGRMLAAVREEHLAAAICKACKE